MRSFGFQRKAWSAPLKTWRCSAMEWTTVSRVLPDLVPVGGAHQELPLDPARHNGGRRRDTSRYLVQETPECHLVRAVLVDIRNAQLRLPEEGMVGALEDLALFGCRRVLPDLVPVGGAHQELPLDPARHNGGRRRDTRLASPDYAALVWAAPCSRRYPAGLLCNPGRSVAPRGSMTNVHEAWVGNLIRHWRDDAGASYRTWFLWEERIKNFRSAPLKTWRCSAMEWTTVSRDEPR
jgi:hypothetical protein